ncbi:MAG: IgGFc-binding protein [Deltaproteobacteria bacterium]|nr:IgGFc-binding protein [Deltaproteobacteria bacterium]
MKRTLTFGLVLMHLVACSSPPVPSGCDPGCPATSVCSNQRCVPRMDAGDMDAREAATAMDAAEDSPAILDAQDVPRDTPRPTGLGCSSDLRSVLGVEGVVLYACEASEGCSEGRCVPACDAAARSKGTIACGFSIPTPPMWDQILAPCHAAFFANTWPLPAQITLTRGGTALDVTRFGRIVDNARPASEWLPIPAAGVPPNEVAVLFLSSDPNALQPQGGQPLNCPTTPAVNRSTELRSSGTTEAFVLTSSVPLSGYDIAPFGGARSFLPSAQLLLPHSVWSDFYVVSAPPVGTHTAPGPQWFQVVAREDNTVVRVRPTVALAAGTGVPAIAAGAMGTVTLRAGEVAQWQTQSASTEPSGTIITSDRPVAVLAGNRFLRLQRTPMPGGESAHQQLLPVNALGSQYAIAPFTTRRMDLAPEAITYRIVGAVDGTTLTTNPVIAGLPAVLNRGELVQLTSTEALVIRSQDSAHPFAISQLMDSANTAAPSRPGAVGTAFGANLGDEEWVQLFPSAQFLKRYVFFADPTYPTTTLTILREARATPAEVRLDCYGVVDGFRPVGTENRYEFAQIDLVRANVGNRGCTNGRHVIESSSPLGVMVWGLDAYSSYGYPAGGNAGTLTEIPPPG